MKFNNCISDVFTVIKGKINKEKDTVQLNYKRVSSYTLMNDIDTFISRLIQNNIPINEIALNLSNTFNIDIEEANKKISQWYSERNFELEAGKKIKLKDNPGFFIEMKHITLTTGEGFTRKLVIEVANINNIHYIDNIDKYIRALMVLITDKEYAAEFLNFCYDKGENKEQEQDILDTVDGIDVFGEIRLDDDFWNFLKILKMILSLSHLVKFIYSLQFSVSVSVSVSVSISACLRPQVVSLSLNLNLNLKFSLSLSLNLV